MKNLKNYILICIRCYINKKKKFLRCVNLGHGSLIGRLYRETDTVLKKLLILIKY